MIQPEGPFCLCDPGMLFLGWCHLISNLNDKQESPFADQEAVYFRQRESSFRGPKIETLWLVRETNRQLWLESCRREDSIAEVRDGVEIYP